MILWLYNYQIENLKINFSTEITSLKTKISSIERNIGENEYFDVNQLFINDKNKKNVSSSYISKGNFYADTTNTNWKFKQIPPVTFIRDGLGIKPIEFQIGKKNSLTLDSIFKNQ